MASIPTPLLCIWVLLVPQVHGEFSGDDFTNNLVSDLGPLLSLFGERFAQQFLSESYSVWDHILFAMAPLGIVTALASVIRVGGYAWQRALIGRARENTAQAELELMSSVSPEVCELWNGEAIVRSMGKPEIKQIIHAPASKDDISPESFITMNPKSHTSEYQIENISEPRSMPKAETALEEEYVEMPPNISLNCHNQCRPIEMKLWAIIATLIQVLVLIYSGFVSSPLLNNVDALNSPNPPWTGFLLQANGTLFLTISMFLCARVIDGGTKEVEWIRANDASESKRAEKSERRGRNFGTMYPIWIQKKHTTADQSFDPFFLASQFPCKVLRTSNRNEASHGIQTTIAVGSGIVGFVVQFEGLRLSNWSCSVAQLVAIFVVTAIRAWIRRGLTQRPKAQKLPDRFELDFLALNIVANKGQPVNKLSMQSPNLAFKFGMHDALPVTFEKSNSTAQKIMDLRIRFGAITQWKSIVSDEAVILANSIDAVLKSLKPEFESRSAGAPHVRVKVNTGKEDNEICFKLHRQAEGRWKIDAAEIEAALSLAVSRMDFASQHQGKDAMLNSNYSNWIRATENYFAERFHHVAVISSHRELLDLLWWTDDVYHADTIPRLSDLDKDGMIGISGFRRGEPAAQHENKAVKLASNRPLLTYLFSAFVWAIAENVPNNTLSHHTRCEFSTSSTSQEGKVQIPGPFLSEVISSLPNLQNPELDELVRKVQQFGLTTANEVYLNLILPLSHFDKLPTEQIVQAFGETLQRSEKLRDWPATSIYFESVLSAVGSRGKLDRVTLRAVAMALELLIHVNEDPKPEYSARRSGREKLQKTLTSACEHHPSLTNAISALMSLYKSLGKQSRFLDDLRSKLSITTLETRNLTPNDFFYENYTDVFGRSYWASGVQPDKEEDALSDHTSDVFGRTIFHHWVTPRMNMILIGSLAKRPCNRADLFGQYPFHRAALESDYNMVNTLVNYSKKFINIPDYAGRTPLCLAAWKGDDDILAELVGNEADIHHEDMWKQGPLTLATRNRKTEAVRYLINRKVNINAKDICGRTALSWAAENGDEPTIRVFLEAFRRQRNPKPNGFEERRDATSPIQAVPERETPNSTTWEWQLDLQDEKGKTPLMFAAENGHSNVLDLLLNAEADPKVVNADKMTVLHIAVVANKEKAVETLLKSEAVRSIMNNYTASGDTALTLAAIKSYERIVVMLLNVGVDVSCMYEDSIGGMAPIGALYMRNEDDEEPICGRIADMIEKAAGPSAAVDISELW